jgi:hypothetical protein
MGVGALGRGVARVSFPRIRSLDSSQTPHRVERAGAAEPLGAVDPAALAAALAAMATGTEDDDDGPPTGGREQLAELRLRLRQREDDLAAARARVAELEAGSGVAQEE